MFTPENRNFWQSIADDANAQRPSVGKTVTVDSGKHAGKVGIVFYHAWDKYGRGTRYASDAQLALREINGRYGFRVGIKTDDGEKLFVNADIVTVKV